MIFKIVIAGIIIYAGYELFRKRKQRADDDESNISDNPQPPIFQTVSSADAKKENLSNNEFVYLSFIGDLLNKYGFDAKNDSSFFEFLTLSRLLGKKLFLNQINDALNEKKSFDKIYDLYNQLKEADVRLDFQTNPENDNSAKIYKSGIQSLFSEFKLLELANDDLKTAVTELIQRKFNSGKEQMVRDFAVNFKWLQKHYETGDIEKLNIEIERLQQEIDEENKTLELS